MKVPELHKRFHLDKDYTSIGLFRELNRKFEIDKVFYPGCYVHITPSLIFSNVTYADSFRSTYKFFEDAASLGFIKENKEYPEEPSVRFYQQDYYEPFTELTDEFDLLISQYAGFVGQAAKPYLKTGGILVCNNSHGDASMASLDADYELIAVYRRKTDELYSISENNLSDYLQPKSGKQPTQEQLTQAMRGVAYTKSPTGYIFEKVN